MGCLQGQGCGKYICQHLDREGGKRVMKKGDSQTPRRLTLERGDIHLERERQQKNGGRMKRLSDKVDEDADDREKEEGTGL